MDLETRQQRALEVEPRLTKDWPIKHWSRDDQLRAFVEGWSMGIVRDRIQRQGIFPWNDFDSDRAAQEFVLARAQEGSELHCRAMVLHVASVLKNEDRNA